MADIKNIDVYQTVTSVSFQVEPNTNVVNINKVTVEDGGLQSLQSVTNIGAITSNSITASSFVKQGGLSTEFLMGNGSVTIGNGGVYSYEIHVSQIDGNDTTGTGAVLNPVATITKALTLVSGLRKTIVIHPGNYTENPSITVQYTVLTTYAQVGGNTALTGTITTNTGCTISGLKMTALTVNGVTGRGNINILNCDISGTFTKNGTADYTLVRFCDIGALNVVSTAGVLAVFGGNPSFITVNSVGASVLVKNAVCISPVVLVGGATFADCILISTGTTTNALTSSAGTNIVLANSQCVIPTFQNVSRVSLSGFYSILNCVFDKPNSTLVALSVTGGSTNSIVYSQFINADKFIKQGGLSTEFLKADGSVSTAPTNLTTSQTASNFTINSDTGTDAIVPLGNGTLAGATLNDYTTAEKALLATIPNINTNAINRDTVKLGEAINKGQAVYVSNATGTNIIVSKASNASEATSSKTFGLLETTGVLNDIINVVTSGLLSTLNTSTATVGDAVWLGTAGNLIFGLANKPVAPAHLVYIGIVTRVSATVGEIFISIQNGFELGEIHDTLLTSVANNDGLFYDSSTSLWKNKSIATALGYTPYNATNPSGYQTAAQVQTIADAKVVQTITNGVTATAPSQDAVFDALALKANDSAVVHTTGAETIAGAKTFSTAPILSSLTASQLLALDASKNIQTLTTATYPSLTELAFVKGVTSPIQTQLTTFAALPIQKAQLTYLDMDYTIFDAFYTRVIADAGTVESTSQLLSTLANLRSIAYIAQGYTQQLNADKFVKLGGTAEKYLMADGSALSNIATNATTTALSLATLNSTYPTAIIGFRAQCISITAGKLIYEKTSTGWVSYSITVIT